MSLFAPITAPSLSNRITAADFNNAPAADPNALPGVTTPGGADPNTPSFGHTLENAFQQVNDAQLHAGEMTRAFAQGQTSDLHSVMIAGEQATLALQMATQIRNKVIDAYQEVMRTSM